MSNFYMLVTALFTASLLCSTLIASITLCNASDQDRKPRVIILDAASDDLQGYLKWPWGVYKSQIESGEKEPYMSARAAGGYKQHP